MRTFEKYYSYEWMQERMTQVDPILSLQMEHYTVAHMAVKARFYRLLHDVCFDKYDFDADFYKPKAKLTLLHVMAKYCSSSYWFNEDLTNLQKLVRRCTNLTLKNNQGFTID